jgi:hypothetical protein
MYPFPFVPDMGKEPTELDPFSAGLYLTSVHLTVSVGGCSPARTTRPVTRRISSDAGHM